MDAQKFITAAAGADTFPAIVPDLEPHCGSWIVVDRTTGEPVFETFSRSVAESVNGAAYEVLTTAQWLGRINQRSPNRRGPWQRPAVRT